MGGLFSGAVAVETLTVLTPGTDGGATRSFLAGKFLPSIESPPCDVDAGPCCFYPMSTPAAGLSAGILTLAAALDDGGTGTVVVPFDPDGGSYQADTFAPINAEWLSFLSASGDVVPAFGIETTRLQGPVPVLTPGLDQLSTLSTGQDWVVPLVPSELEYLFSDRVIVEADGVGLIVCQTADEGALNPPLVVSASLLANFSGHQGTVTIYRDDDPGAIDAGAVLLDYRVGIGIQTPTDGVSFTP